MFEPQQLAHVEAGTDGMVAGGQLGVAQKPAAKSGVSTFDFSRIPGVPAF